MDVASIRLAIGVLGGLAGLCVAGIVLLSVVGHEPPAVLGYLASGCGSAIIGILVNTQPPPAAGRGGGAGG